MKDHSQGIQFIKKEMEPLKHSTSLWRQEEGEWKENQMGDRSLVKELLL